MRIKRCSVILFALAVACGPVLAQMGGGSAAAVDAKWPSLGGGFARTGQSSDIGPLSGEVRWKFETDGAIVGSVTVVGSAVVGAAGRIHVACEDGKLYALDSNGKVQWVLDVNAPLVSAPSIGPDGSLYVGGKSGKLYAVAPDGQLRWTHATGGAVYSSPAVGAKGDVYVGSTDGTLYALAAGDGAELWRFKTKGPGVLPNGAVFASPSIGPDGTVYVGGLYDPTLYALSPADGSVKWSCRFPNTSKDPNTGGWPFASPVVAADGTIYQTLLCDPNLYAIEPASGAIRWSVNLCDARYFRGIATVPVDSDGWSEPVVGPDGTIYVSLDDSYLRAVDPAGTLKWVTRLGDSIEDIYGGGASGVMGGVAGTQSEAGGLTLTVDSSGTVFAASENGQLYVVSPVSLTVAQFTTGGWPAFPVIAGDGVLILADSKDYSSLEKGAKNTVWAIDARVFPQRSR
ncbi:MAG: PQQ-binding-like beta-propeller repeat protein [Phycisphaerales bacterium]